MKTLLDIIAIAKEDVLAKRPISQNAQFHLMKKVMAFRYIASSSMNSAEDSALGDCCFDAITCTDNEVVVRLLDRMSKLVASNEAGNRFTAKI